MPFLEGNQEMVLRVNGSPLWDINFNFSIMLISIVKPTKHTLVDGARFIF